MEEYCLKALKEQREQLDAAHLEALKGEEKERNATHQQGRDKLTLHYVA
jgi:hypothetical protein